MAEVSWQSATCTYPKATRPAVSALELQVEDGELLVLVGPSGCGKSTALRMLAGLEHPTSGRILIGDKDVTMLPANERDVSMVFQSYALFPHMTALAHRNSKPPLFPGSARSRSAVGPLGAVRV